MDRAKIQFDEETIMEIYGKPNFAMAYGSGVYPKGEGSTQDKMIDMAFGVENCRDWHSKNLYVNGSDYSLLARVLGVRFISWLQNCVGAKIYYNTEIKLLNRRFKYGVISMEDLMHDLTEWETLYLAGRLHKPVHIMNIKDDIRDQITDAIQINREHALDLALLLSPENFTREKLFELIAGLSYIGDARMEYAEDQDSPFNLVDGNFEGFERIYSDIIKIRSKFLATLNDGKLQRNMNPQDCYEVFKTLPKNLHDNVQQNLDHPVEFDDRPATCNKIIRALISIINAPSRDQAIKGALTADPHISIPYALRKRKKKTNSKTTEID